MLLKQGWLENMKKFLETQNTRSEIKSKTRARGQSSGTLFERRKQKSRGGQKKKKKKPTRKLENQLRVQHLIAGALEREKRERRKGNYHRNTSSKHLGTESNRALKTMGRF